MNPDMLRDLERLQEMRELFRESNRRVAKLRKKPSATVDDLEREETIAQLAGRKMASLEKRLLDSELGFQ